MKIKNKIPWSSLAKLPDSRKLGKTKIQILNASLSILVKNGIQELSLTRIAKEAEISKSLVLYHYESKTKILEELFFFTNKILLYLLDKYDPEKNSFEMRIAGMMQALQQWYLYNDEISELILLMFHESNKSVRLKELFQTNNHMLTLRFERIFLESMRYKTLEEVRLAVSGVMALIGGTMIKLVREENAQEIQDAIFRMRLNIEHLLNIEVPAIELKESAIFKPLFLS